MAGVSPNSAIGVLDSGVGGLSVLRELTALLPSDNFIYVSDSAHAPYGPKPKEVVLERCRQIMGFFIARQVKAVVLACNTATAAAVAELREEFSLPIIGMEPALKPAAAMTETGVVGVLATEGTIESDKFLDLKSRFSGQVEFITVACHGLVDAIENQQPELRKELLKKYIAPVLEKNADTLILGCTHYPLIKNEILDVSNELGSFKIKLIDTGEAVAKELQRRLEEKELLGVSKNRGQVSFFDSGSCVDQDSSENNSVNKKALLKSYWSQDLSIHLLTA